MLPCKRKYWFLNWKEKRKHKNYSATIRNKQKLNMIIMSRGEFEHKMNGAVGKIVRFKEYSPGTILKEGNRFYYFFKTTRYHTRRIRIHPRDLNYIRINY